MSSTNTVPPTLSASGLDNAAVLGIVGALVGALFIAVMVLIIVVQLQRKRIDAVLLQQDNAGAPLADVASKRTHEYGVFTAQAHVQAQP